MFSSETVLTSITDIYVTSSELTYTYDSTGNTIGGSTTGTIKNQATSFLVAWGDISCSFASNILTAGSDSYSFDIYNDPDSGNCTITTQLLNTVDAPTITTTVKTNSTFTSLTAPDTFINSVNA